MASKYSVEKQYTDYIEMLETEEIDLVSVCTRPKLHAPVTIETAKRGVKGILSEKADGGKTSDRHRRCLKPVQNTA